MTLKNKIIFRISIMMKKVSAAISKGFELYKILDHNMNYTCKIIELVKILFIIMIMIKMRIRTIDMISKQNNKSHP